MAKTSASFTLMDYTDGISLITGIDSNLPFTNLYDTANQTLNPSWAGDTSLILTPRVLKAGTSTDLVTSMIGKGWKRRISSGTWINVTSGSNGESINSSTGALTVTEDKLVGDVWQVEYKFVGTYHDDILNLDFPVEIVSTFSRVANGTSFVVARAYAVNGSQFKNEQPASLEVKAELIRGSTTDATNLTYTWEKSTNGTSWTSVGGNTSTLSVTPSMVDSFAMFRCSIKDIDPASNTYEQVFVTEGISVLDVSDPYQAVIESTAGNIFKNNTGTTNLICRVYQNGSEVDSNGTSLTYAWTRTDKDGVADVSFSPVGVPVGSIVATNRKAIAVSHDEVDVKATYFCEVS